MAAETIHKGLEGVVIDESELSRVYGDEGRLVYRGVNIETLAAEADFEETLYFLWNDSMPTRTEYQAFRADLAAKRSVPPAMLESMLPTCAELEHHPMNVVQSAVSVLAGDDPNVAADFESDQAAVMEIGKRIVATIPTITAAYHRIRNGESPIEPRDDLGHAANFLYMLSGREPAAPFVDALGTSLQLHMDHGVNASTFTTRVVASTLANPYEAVSAGTGALAGPLHGGANQDVLEMLTNLDASNKGIPEWVEDRMASDAVIAGWGHRVYSVKDPRAVILQEHATELIESGKGDAKWVTLARELEEYLLAETDFAEKGIAPNVDYYSGAVYSQMGIPTDLFTNVFTMSRVGGWMGHILEQYQANRIIRPRVRYVGKMDREWFPMDER